VKSSKNVLNSGPLSQGMMLKLAQDKIDAGCLFEHAFAHLEIAERLHKQLTGKPCGPALWNQAPSLQSIVCFPFV